MLQNSLICLTALTICCHLVNNNKQIGLLGRIHYTFIPFQFQMLGKLSNEQVQIWLHTGSIFVAWLILSTFFTTSLGCTLTGIPRFSSCAIVKLDASLSVFLFRASIFLDRGISLVQQKHVMN